MLATIFSSELVAVFSTALAEGEGTWLGSTFDQHGESARFFADVGRAQLAAGGGVFGSDPAGREEGPHDIDLDGEIDILRLAAAAAAQAGGHDADDRAGVVEQ